MSNGGTPQPDSHLVPGDHTYHDDKGLIADLTALNGQISRYVLRHLDSEAERAVPTSPDDERTLGLQLVRLGTGVLGRAERRQRLPLPRGSTSVVSPPTTETTT
jgi:hypothetical protein